MSARALTVGLLDHMGGGNLGDDSTQTAVIAEIRSRWPHATIIGLSMNPADTERRHAIPSYPIRRNTWVDPARSADPSDRGACGARAVASSAGRLRAASARFAAALAEAGFLLRSLRVIRRVDILVISGGGQLLDSWGGAWAYPYTLLKWALLAKLTGARCYFVSVGAGPLRSRLSQLFVRSALRLADYVSLRDADSKALLRQIGFRGTAQVYPDCVYGLPVPPADAARKQADHPVTVGLSPMAYCDPRRYWVQDQAAYSALLAKFVDFGAWADQCGYHPELFSTDIWFDAQTLQAVDEGVRQARRSNRSFYSEGAAGDLSHLLSQLATMDYVITCRFHGVVFAHLMNIPVIALSHHPKVTTLMGVLGLSEYCLDIDKFSTEQLRAAFLRMMDQRADIKSRMRRKAEEFRSALSTQFDQLFPIEASQ